MYKILKHIPNILTLFRLGLIIPFIQCLYHHNYTLAFYIFFFAGFTDGLDGWLARHFNCKSTFGSFVDPMADKLLVAVSFISLALLNSIPVWLVILVFLRDISISIGVLVWYWHQRPLNFVPTLLSKFNTTVQLSLVSLCLFELAYFKFPPYLMHSLIYLTAFTTAASYIDYFWTWGRRVWLPKDLPQ